MAKKKTTSASAKKARAKKSGSKSVAAGRAAFKGLVIRTGAVHSPNRGTLLACDPRKEQRDIPHVIGMKWQDGTFTRKEAKFNARTACFLGGAVPTLLVASEQGNYSLAGQGGNIFRESGPEPSVPRYGGISVVCGVAGVGFAAGHQGSVFRLERAGKWTRIDAGLPIDFDIEGMDGFGPDDLYAVGFKGQLWHFDGRTWTRRQLPTEVTLQAVKCGGDGVVYVGGKAGTLIRGRDANWSALEQHATHEEFWDLEWWEGVLYASTMLGVFRLDGNKLCEVDFGPDEPETTYHLSAAPGVLWSIGSDDVMAFDGRTWSRIV